MANDLEENMNYKIDTFVNKRLSKSKTNPILNLKKNITITMSGLAFIIAVVLPIVDDFSAEKKIENNEFIESCIM